MISVSSVLNAIIFYTIFLALARQMRKNTEFLEAGGGFLLLILVAVATLRLILPIEIPVTYTISSWAFMGTIVRILRTYPAITLCLSAVWGIGAGIFMFRDAVDLYRSRKESRSYTNDDNETVQEVARRCLIPCPVRVSRNVDIPYVTGFFRHTIYLPTLPASEFPEERIEHILRHEAQHIYNHDALIKLAFGLLSAAMWWNPVTRRFRREIDALLELRCDADVTKHMDALRRVEYGETLTAVGRLVTHKRIPALALDESPVSGKGGDLLSQRIKVLAYGRNKPPRRVSAAVQCVLLVLFCASYLVIFQPAIMPWEEKFDTQTNVYYHEDHNGPEIGDEMSSAFIVKGTDGRYQLFVDYQFIGFLTESEVNSNEYRNLHIFEEDMQK